MKDLVDYIKYHGRITRIRNNVDKDYIWFDICQKELYTIFIKFAIIFF